MLMHIFTGDNMTDWYDKEVEALEKLYEDGQISQLEFKFEMQQLNHDAKEELDRQAIIDAGRGYLLR